MFPDISEFQGVVDWDTLGAAFGAGQIEAVSMRAGFGTVRADHQFARNQAECRARGIPAIFYWFNYPAFNAPQAEAAMFNAVVGPLRPHEAMMGDFEDDAASGSVFPRGQAGVDWASAFLTAVEAPQNATWWYTYPALFYAVGFGPLLGVWPFVLADYRASPDAGLEAAAIALQFTDCGATPGVTGCCDQNRVLKPPLGQWLTGGPSHAVEDNMLLLEYLGFRHVFYVDGTGQLINEFQPTTGAGAWNREVAATGLPPGAAVRGAIVPGVAVHLYVQKADGSVVHASQGFVPPYTWTMEPLP